MGVRVAIDDFGIGYTTLSRLKQLPLDTIKIDGSFIQDVVRSADGKRQTEAIITLGRSLGHTVLAECVETVEHADFLRSHAYDEIQGFYVHEPMPAAECTQRLHEQMLAAVGPRP
jgi:EAL domain-containing protein (putative c-di-GMP-specific phosphodiesterase class I)